ncbi:hypothetical protein BDC45DRAFT_530208 [Circinella umbellata]|nr:hypothetical protein BDC45DRAFT_530208 [Circinella umbellata]
MSGEASSYLGGGGSESHGYGQPQQSPYDNPYSQNVADASRYARQHSDQDDDDEGMFSGVLSKVLDKKDSVQASDDDVQYAENNHRQMYNEGADASSPHDIGSAAAVEAFQKHRSSGGDGGMNALLGMAMGEASKLFSQKQGGGGASSSDKSEALQAAAMMAFKLYSQKQGGGSGGSSDGGIGSMIGALMGGQGGGQKSSGSDGLGGMVSSMLSGGKQEEPSMKDKLTAKLIGKLL